MKTNRHDVLRVAVTGIFFLLVSIAGDEASLRGQTSGKMQSGASAREQIRLMNQELENIARASAKDAHPRERDQIEALLKQRVATLAQVIKQDPAGALELELAREIRAGLAKLESEAGSLLESTGEWEGRLDVVVEDDFQTGASRTVRHLTGTDGALEVYFAGEMPPPGAGQIVKVMGMRLGLFVAASEWRFEGGVRSDASACNTTGEQRIAVLLVSFPNKPLLSTITSDMMNTTYFGQGLSLDSYLQESSYGKARATGQVFGPFVLDADYIGQPFAVRDAAIRAASGLVDFRKFNRIALVVPQAGTGLVSGGMGTLGCSEIPLYPNGSVVASTTWLGDVSLGDERERVGAAIHEMGHNLGLHHARAADFGDEPLGPAGQLPAPWDQVHEYGDSFSNMGRGLGHWAAQHKLLLGWLQRDTDIPSVETSGSFVLQPYEDATSGVKAIRVRRGTGNDAWLWLEYRQPLGPYDSGLPASAFTGGIIHYEDAGWKDTYAYTNLLRFNAEGQQAVFFFEAPLAAGSGWTDPYSNLTINVNRATTSGLEVGVSFAPAPVCPGSLSPGRFDFEAAGGTGSIDVVAPSGCSWTATSSVSWIQISSGATGMGSGRLTFSVSASSVTADRWGRIVAGSTIAVVIQKGLAGNATIYPLSAEFRETGGTGEVSVSTNAPDFAWLYSSGASWIQSLSCSKSDSIGSAILRYIVAQNTSSAARTGTIDVAGQTFTVTQIAGGPKVSQIVWQDLKVQDAPMARHCMDMAPSASPGEAVLYGGAWDLTCLTDTWIWNGSAWTQKNPAHNPGARCGHAMAYDAARGQVVLFGSAFNSGSPYTNETWIWDGTDWKQLHPQNSPSARVFHAMAYNPLSKKIILFGGVDNYGRSFSDTWEWDGSNWTQAASTKAPPARYQHAMAYDTARDEIVLFGGYLWPPSSPPIFFADTWVWDGFEWQQKPTEVSPSPRYGHRMEYDPELGQVILVGGSGGKDISSSAPFTYALDFREETWTWNGTSWTQRYPDASPVDSWTYGMVYDSVHRAFITHLGDSLRCADRGPKTYVLKAGPGAILLAPYFTVIPASGGQGSIAVTADVPWTATTIDSWITIPAGGSGNGNGTVKYEISAYPSAGMRKGTILVGGQVFSIRQAGVPARLISPSGNITTNNPTYSWNAVAAATKYQLWINDSAATPKFQAWYTASEAGCSSGAGTCSVAPAAALAQGAGQWWIQTWNEAGYGPWSEPMSFAVSFVSTPGKATLVSPAGTISTATPAYTWNAVPSATWYYLWVNINGTAAIQTWYTAAQAECASGIGTCSVAPAAALAQGAGQWWIRTWNEAGYGPWSDGMSFTVSGVQSARSTTLPK